MSRPAAVVPARARPPRRLVALACVTLLVALTGLALAVWDARDRAHPDRRPAGWSGPAD